MNKSSNFHDRLLQLHRALGIAPDYLASCSMPLCEEATELVDTELDYYQRPQQLTPEALAAWTAMKQAAAADDITLHLISAFRGIQYQHDLIAEKLEMGLELDAILAVNAAPGFSEHHTGRAIDIGTLDCPALVEEFENTPAFQWLTNRAGDFAFAMTYPPGNAFGIDYEPWHWCFQISDSEV